MKSLLVTEAIAWGLWLGYAIHLDNIQAAERALIVAWKRYFKEEVASEWLFHDGVGL